MGQAVQEAVESNSWPDARNKLSKMKITLTDIIITVVVIVVVAIAISL